MNSALISVDRLRRTDRQVCSGRPLLDRLNRPLTDLRLSVTDRCNFRCTYCMPRSKLGPVAAATLRSNLLTFEELAQIASAFVSLGVRKIRITGGEPLVRQALPELVALLRRLPIEDLCLTTNGSLLSAHATDLARAGLGRVTVSLDALDEPTFQRITDSTARLGKVLSGIDAARKAGLGPIKINTVVQRGVNEHCIIPMAHWARREGLELRFIEYMDVGCSNGWSLADVVPAAEIVRQIQEQWPLESCGDSPTTDTARRFRYTDGMGFMGTIASITQPFCGSCARARVSSLGDFYACLFASVGYPLLPALRQGDDVRAVIAGLWRGRTDRYSELRSGDTTTHARAEMFALGG